MYTFKVEHGELQDKWVVPLYRTRHLIEDLVKAGKVEIKHIGDWCDVASGSYIRGYVPEGESYLRVDNIRQYICNINPDDLVQVDATSPEINDRILTQPGDVLLARTGTLGKAGMAWGPISRAIMSQHVSRLRIRDNAPLLPGYLAAFLNSDLGKYQLIYSGYGSTRLELTHTALRNVSVAAPPVDWQRHIDHEVKASITGLYRSVSLYREAVDLVEDFFGIPSEEKRPVLMKIMPERLGKLWTPRFYEPAATELVAKIRSDWSFARLGDMAAIERGKGTRVSDYATKGTPFIRTSSLINFGIDPFPDHYAADEVVAAFNQPTYEGDILFSIEGKIGEAAYLTSIDQCVFKNHIELVRTSQDQLFTFLLLSSRIGRWQARMNTVVQATLPGMADRLRNILIPLEPIAHDRRQEWARVRSISLELARGAASLRASCTERLRQAASEVELHLESVV